MNNAKRSNPNPNSNLVRMLGVEIVHAMVCSF